MKRVAAGLLLAGLLFVFFSIPLFGVDLLIDAVGFVLVFNAARALQRLEPGFRFAAPCSLVLAAVSALQLFLFGGVGFVLAVARALLQAALFVILQNGFYRLLAAQGRSGAGTVFRALFLLNAAQSLAAGTVLFFAPAAPVVLAVGTGLHLALLGALLWLALLPEKAA